MKVLLILVDGMRPDALPKIENAPYDFSFSGLKTAVINIAFKFLLPLAFEV